MPSDKIKVYGLASTDPYNISIRLCSWVRETDFVVYNYAFMYLGSNARLFIFGTS